MLKHYFIPHKQNDYKPHFFREASIVSLSFVVTLFFFAAVVERTLILHTSLFADIFPKVLVDLANNDRQRDSLSQLKVNAVLERAAQLKANDMATKGYFAHNSPEGVTPWYWFEQAGYDFAYAGENLAVDFSDSAEVDRAWMASPGHRANILGSHFNEIGIATAKGLLDGRETIFVVQMFGRSKTPSRIVENFVTPVNVAAVAPRIESTTSPVLGSTASVVENKVLGETEEEGNNVPAPLPQVEAPVSSPFPVAEPLLDDSVSAAVQPESTFVEKFVSSPIYSLSFLYFLLILFIVLALGLMVFIKIQIQHPRNIVYGFGVLALIGFLFFVFQSFVLSPVIIG